MKILAIDTATEACSAALAVDGEVFERYEVLGRGHADRILPMVQEVLAEGGVALAALDAIAFGRGPGGFTGLRIAAGVTQGLAFGASLPVVPVSDLAALAARAARLRGARHVLACLDARMAQVYWAAYDCTDPAAPLLLAPERVSDPGDLAAVDWRDGGSRKGDSPLFQVEKGDCPLFGALYGAGHGFAAYPALHTLLGDRLIGFDAELLPHAGEIALIGAREAAAGRTVAPEEAQPVYLRDEVAHRR
jgi:tRNA threonylcarbamoyladenosine biosynthesis protein TsaB